jgi:hypothetical protein
MDWNVCQTIGLYSYQMWTYVSDYPLDSLIDSYDCCICALNNNNNNNKMFITGQCFHLNPSHTKNI